MADTVRSPFVTFVVECPACHAEVPLPLVVVTPVMETWPGGNRLAARLTEIPSVEHSCAPAVARG